MRIRKHAKISPLLYATSSQDAVTLPQAHICQFNQSPWDVMNFSPPRPCPPPTPPSQVYGNDCSSGNGSSRDSIAVTRREWTTNELNKATKCEYSGSISDGAAPDDTEQEACTSPKDNPIVLCCNTDSKCWQCRREAAKGNSLCEHHLLMFRNYSNYNSAHSATKNSEKSSAETRGRPRNKKRSAPSLSNPNEFYYYTGFGPRWGKKRGEVSKNINEELNMPRNDLEDDKEASSLCDIEDDHLDKDGDEDQEKKEEIEKKRARKPIKARSLKSLM